ncbi:hypothetical protein GCM10027594_05250 [Hymenobacter agri]
MKTSFSTRQSLLIAVAPLLALAACSKTDTPAITPVADTGRVLTSHAAAAANTTLTAFVNDTQISQLSYGQSSAYVTVNAGSPTLRINNGTQVATTQTLNVAKNQNYSVFEYSPAATIGSLALLTTPDDLTAPATGQAKVRLVYLNTGGTSPVQLTAPSPTPTSAGTPLTPDVAFATASEFVALNAGLYNLTVTSNGSPRPQVIAVGDGSGSGTGVFKYTEGRIYTIVVRGITGTGVPAGQQPQAVVIQNN